MSARILSTRLSAARRAATLLAVGTLGAACADQPTSPASPADLRPDAARQTPNCRIACPSDSGKILFVRNVVVNQSGQLDLFKSNVDGTGLVRLTNSPEAESEPSWSPDFKKIVFVRKAFGSNGDLFIMDADGSNEKRLTKTSESDELYPTWRPDGSGIVFMSNHKYSATYAGRHQLSLINADGSSYGTAYPHLPTLSINETCPRTGPCSPTNGAQSIAWPHMGPNNREIAYVVWNPVAGRPGIRVWDMYSQEKRWIYGDTPLPAGETVYPQVAYPRFSPDGTKIAYIVDDDVVVANARTGGVLQTFSTDRVISSLSWSPDGGQLLTHQGFPNVLLRMDLSNGFMAPLFNSSGAQTPNWSR